MRPITNTVEYNSQTDSATHTQAGGAFTIELNYTLGSHQVHAYTDVDASAGTLAVEYEVANGRFLPLRDAGTPISVDMTAPEAFDIDVHTDRLRFTPTGFDADKFIGVRVYSRNVVA